MCINLLFAHLHGVSFPGWLLHMQQMTHSQVPAINLPVTSRDLAETILFWGELCRHKTVFHQSDVFWPFFIPKYEKSTWIVEQIMKKHASC